jgi:hypothetical protein
MALGSPILCIDANPWNQGTLFSDTLMRKWCLKPGRMYGFSRVIYLGNGKPEVAPDKRKGLERVEFKGRSDMRLCKVLVTWCVAAQTLGHTATRPVVLYRRAWDLPCRFEFHNESHDPIVPVITWPGAHEIVRDVDAHRLVELQVSGSVESSDLDLVGFGFGDSQSIMIIRIVYDYMYIYKYIQ